MDYGEVAKIPCPDISQLEHRRSWSQCAPAGGARSTLGMGQGGQLLTFPHQGIT